MKYINFFLLFFFITHLLMSEVINKKDLDLLKEEDKSLFLSKCFSNEEYSNSLNCINFLGIKIFLEAYKDETIKNEMFEEITSKSIKYLKYSANKGNKDSYINLGWVFSVNKSSFYNLNKSAEYYNKAQSKDIKVIKKYNTEAKEKKQKATDLNYSYIKLSTALIKQLEIYFSYSEAGKTFISKKEIKEANMIYDKIISKTNINNKALKKLKEKITSENRLILGFLKDDLKVYNKKYKYEAELVLEKLKSIYSKLN